MAAFSPSRRIDGPWSVRLYDFGVLAVDDQGLAVVQSAIGNSFGAAPGHDPLDGSRLGMPWDR
jgi:hypothetical protein